MDWYINPVKWASFIGQCALLVFLPLNVYQVRLTFHRLKSLPYELLNRFGVEQWELERYNLNTGNLFSYLGSLVPIVWLALGSPHLVPKEYTMMRGGCPNFVYFWMIYNIYSSSRKEDFIMITNSLLPWKSNQISLNEGDIVQAPTRR